MSQRQSGASSKRPTDSVPAMLSAVGVLAVIVLAAAGLMSQCSFTPTGPTSDPASYPHVNAGAALHRMARDSDFPVRQPALPPRWQANSTDEPAVPGTGNARAARVGWITPANHYLRLSQSTAPEGPLVRFETRHAPLARGTVRAGGEQWVEYRGQRGERAWVAELPGARVLITGNGNGDEFRALAAAVHRAPVLPR